MIGFHHAVVFFLEFLDKEITFCPKFVEQSCWNVVKLDFSVTEAALHRHYWQLSVDNQKNSLINFVALQ